jgi:ubiquinone/menaquinone biosynthesis C-methylase UbiE
MTTWHEGDEFWHVMAPFLFSQRLWAAAPIEIDQMLQLLDLHPGASVLDLCCGPGRHALELARRGFCVTGVDRTAAYLNMARQRAEEEGLAVEFILEDMRDFCRPQAYHGALLMYTSFGYFEDPAENQQVLLNVQRSLAPGGTLIVDMMGKEVLARIFLERTWSEHEDGVFLLQERKVSRNWSWIENRWIVLDVGRRHEFEVSHWLYSASELVSLLYNAGFGEVDIYGDLEGAAYDHHAKRLVAAARKTEVHNDPAPDRNHVGGGL